MRCAKCGSDNRDGRKFCAKCGVALARPCPRCGASNEPGEDFCGDCGTALVDRATSAADGSHQAASTTPGIRVTPEQAGASTTIDGERKRAYSVRSAVRPRSIRLELSSSIA